MHAPPSMPPFCFAAQQQHSQQDNFDIPWSPTEVDFLSAVRSPLENIPESTTAADIEPSPSSDDVVSSGVDVSPSRRIMAVKEHEKVRQHSSIININYTHLIN